MDQLADPTGITVTGTGRVARRPEVAVLDAGVTLSGGDLAATRDAAATKLTAARQHLLDAGVAPADLQTGRLTVHSSFDRQGRRTSYHLSASLSATMRRLDDADAIVDGLFSAVGDGLELRGLRFDLADPTAGREEALALAYRDAETTAARLAALAGVSLGPVLAIAEAAAELGGPMPAMRAAAAGVAAIPVEAGTVDQRATITVRWAIGD